MKPTSIWARLVTVKMAKSEPVTLKEEQGVEDYIEIGGGKNGFPHEYAVSGWFRWQPLKD